MSNCMICGNKLDHEPKLGEWIAHDKCRDEVVVRCQEARNHAERVVRRRTGKILDRMEHLNNVNGKGTDFDRGYRTAVDTMRAEL